MADYIKIENAAKAFSIHSPYCYNDCLDNLYRSVLDGTIEKEDVEPVIHGKWEIEEVDYGYCDAIKKNFKANKYKCSVCGYETGTQAEKFICCPICTARMDL